MPKDIESCGEVSLPEVPNCGPSSWATRVSQSWRPWLRWSTTGAHRSLRSATLVASGTLQEERPQPCQTQMKQPQQQQQQKTKKSQKDNTRGPAGARGGPTTRNVSPSHDAMLGWLHTSSGAGSPDQLYHPAMQDPVAKIQYTTLAKVMELAKQTQGNKKRKRTNWHCANNVWSVTADSNHGQRWQEHRGSVKQPAAGATLAKWQHLEELSRFADSSPSPALHVFVDSQLRQVFLPPVANSTTSAVWWKPDVRETVLQVLPRVVQQDAIKH